MKDWNLVKLLAGNIGRIASKIMKDKKKGNVSKIAVVEAFFLMKFCQEMAINKNQVSPIHLHHVVWYTTIKETIISNTSKFSNIEIRAAD